MLLKRQKKTFSILACLWLASLAGCEKAEPPKPFTKVVDAPFIQPVMQDIPLYLKYAGNSAAVETVHIVARTRGFIDAIHFTDGQFVNKGDLLYTIEEVYNEADVNEAKANVQIATATRDKALLEYNRQQTLLKRKLTSKEDVDKARLEYQSAEAQLQQDIGKLRQATLELDYTNVLAPFSGRMSRTLYYPGELVDPDDTAGISLLTSLAKLDPLYVYVQVPSNQVQSVLLARHKQGVLPVRFYVSSDQKLEVVGHLEFINNLADTSTGTLEMRATVKNPSVKVFPGQYGYLFVQVGAEDDALLVPKSSVLEDFNGFYVYVIDKDNKLVRKPVDIHCAVEDWLHVTGLHAGEKIIYGDMPLMYSGLKVRPHQAKVPKLPAKPLSTQQAEVPATGSSDAGKPKDGSEEEKKEPAKEAPING